MKKITQDLVIQIHKKIEKISGKKFLPWKKSRWYSYFAKRDLRLFGISKEEIKEFPYTTAMTTKKHFMIPYIPGNRSVIKIRNKCIFIDFKQQIEIAFHELQHSIDSVNYYRYLTDKTYRGNIEMRGYSVSDEINYMLGIPLGQLEISNLYRLDQCSKRVFEIGRKSTRRNISNGPVFQASKIAKALLS